jgi:hypothetical protein
LGAVLCDDRGVDGIFFGLAVRLQQLAAVGQSRLNRQPPLLVFEVVRCGSVETGDLGHPIVALDAGSSGCF